MAHTLMTIIFTLLALAIAYLDVRGWLKNKRIWFMISLIGSILAAIAFWLPTWVVGFLFIVPAVLLFVLGTVFKRVQSS